MYSTRILKDSMAPCGKRLTTWELTYPRFVHAELIDWKSDHLSGDELDARHAQSRPRPVEKERWRQHAALVSIARQAGTASRQRRGGGRVAFENHRRVEAHGFLPVQLLEKAVTPRQQSRAADRWMRPQVGQVPRARRHAIHVHRSQRTAAHAHHLAAGRVHTLDHLGPLALHVARGEIGRLAPEAERQAALHPVLGHAPPQRRVIGPRGQLKPVARLAHG